MKINASASRKTSKPKGSNPLRNFILILPVALTLFSIQAAFHLIPSVLCRVGEFGQSVKLVDIVHEGISMKPVHTIGIVNAGGDAPGLHAVIRDVVDSSITPFARILGTHLASRLPIWGPAANSGA